MTKRRFSDQHKDWKYNQLATVKLKVENDFKTVFEPRKANEIEGFALKTRFDTIKFALYL